MIESSVQTKDNYLKTIGASLGSFYGESLIMDIEYTLMSGKKDYKMVSLDKKRGVVIGNLTQNESML
jgi:hypothetical protein